MDERRIVGMDGWTGGRGGLPQGLIKGDRMRKTRRKKKKEDTAYPPLFLSKANVTAAEACLLVLPFS